MLPPPPPPPVRSLRVAVIGAGPAGLAAARELRGEGHSPVVFERGAGVGGTWVYDADDDSSGSGRGSLYASLRTNLPREVMGFLDFPFAADAAGRRCLDPRRFPRHEEVLRYIHDFARRFDLHGLVRLRTQVVAVERLRVDEEEQDGGGWRWRWRVSFSDPSSDGNDDEVFDAVVVCNGHYTEPRFAAIPGVEAWPGTQMHSRGYRAPDRFRGQVVVIVGAKNSGADISREVAAVAREVHMASWSADSTYRCHRMPGHANLWLHSMVERAGEDGSVAFRDGTTVEKVDVILHCTGYKYSFPFLRQAVGVEVDDNRVHPLYRQVFPPHLAGGLSFIGLPFKVVPFPMFQLQASWVAGVLSGRIQLPEEEEMMADVAASYARLDALGWPVRYTHCLKHDQFEYDDWVAEQCGRAGVEQWRRNMYDAAKKKMTDCPDTYRDEWDDHHLLQQAYQHFQTYY